MARTADPQRRSDLPDAIVDHLAVARLIREIEGPAAGGRPGVSAHARG
ncbi:hypothetical protein ACFSKW_46965 [Nonomuraea mangrovi]|uniref:FXSXX-COOH protein n=1 Tax=Nonomuraea mangrovi TaxID=2316207 RepID=A0ABW4TF58_9ACTN